MLSSTLIIRTSYDKKSNKSSKEEFFLYIVTRVLFLIVAFSLSTYVQPYYTFDDMELYAKSNLQNTDPVFCILQRQSWWAVCAILNSIPLLGALQLPRLLNIFWGWLCIKEFKKTLQLIGCNNYIIRRGTRFLILFPIFTMFSCSIVKDVMGAWCVWVLINELFCLIDNNRANVFKIIVCTLLGMTIRFGVVESLFGIMYIAYFLRSKGKRKAIAGFVGIFILFFFAGFWYISQGNIIFEQKTRIYMGDTNTAKGTQSLIEMMFDIVHKLVGAAPLIHPQGDYLLWISFLGYLSIFNIYCLYWVFIWIICKRKNWKEIFLLLFLFVWMFFLSYLDAIIYRQILFVIPVTWIIGSKAMYSCYGTNQAFLKFSSYIVSTVAYFVIFVFVRL